MFHPCDDGDEQLIKLVLMLGLSRPLYSSLLDDLSFAGKRLELSQAFPWLTISSGACRAMPSCLEDFPSKSNKSFTNWAEPDKCSWFGLLSIAL